MIPTVRRVALALTVAAVSLAAGCADVRDTAVVPTAPDIGPAFSTKAEVASLARFNVRPQITIAWARKWIGPEGGRLDFHGFAIDVPAGAVSRTTQFSIRLPVTTDGSDHVIAEFGPHNTTFAEPLTIELPYRGTTIEGSASATVVWWNEGWVDMGGSVTADGERLSTTTDHFSTYGTTDDARGPGVSTSGG
jgi:hypothetical protein